MADAISVRIRITKVVDDGDLLEQIEPRMTSLGQAIGVRMQRLVPKKTWALHDSIIAETHRDRDAVTTTVSFGGGDVDYGMYVEQGTSRMAAQPFARPALLQSKAGDMSFGGSVQTHGVASITTRRARVRARSKR